MQYLLVLVSLLTVASVCCHRVDPSSVPENVSNNAGCSEDVSMAVDSKGTVHLVWTDNTPGLEQGHRSNQEIFYACKPDGDTWSSPVNLTRNVGASRFPCLVVDREDRLHAVWQDCSPAGHWAIFYVSKSLGAEWSVPETLSGAEGRYRPWIAVDSAVDVHLVWLTGSYDYRIWYATRSQSSGWSAPVAVLPKPSFVLTPVIACDRQGGMHVAWSGSDSLDDVRHYVYYRYKAPGGCWLPWQPISLTGYVATSDVAMAVDHNSNAHFVWIDNYKEHGCVTYRERYADGTWSDVMPCSTITGGLPGGPLSLAVGPDDRLHMVWSDVLAGYAKTNPLCYASKAGASWWERRVLTDCLPNYPAVGVGPQGDVHVAYDDYVDVNTGNTDIFYLQAKN